MEVDVHLPSMVCTPCFSKENTVLLFTITDYQKLSFISYPRIHLMRKLGTIYNLIYDGWPLLEVTVSPYGVGVGLNSRLCISDVSVPSFAKVAKLTREPAP